ncbi:type-F conjugative transfer system secretin TraK, partial [Salmonella enterica]
TLMKGDIPPGYVFSPVVAAPVFSLPAGLIARADGMWSGDLLRVYRYRISNRQQHAAVLSESQFSAPGVRSVVIYPRAETLLPGATTDV